MVDFECRIRRSPRRKTLSICVYPDNMVVVAAPEKLSQSEIMRFVEDKSEWVRKRISLNLEKQKNKAPRRYVSGERILYLGKEHFLIVEEGTLAGVVLNSGNIIVRIRGLPPELLEQMVRRQLSLVRPPVPKKNRRTRPAFRTSNRCNAPLGQNQGNQIKMGKLLVRRGRQFRVADHYGSRTGSGLPCCP